MTSELAPSSRVDTLTSGSSMRGYSRTDSCLNETSPTSTSSNDITVASTGRRIEVSESLMARCRPSGLRPRTRRLAGHRARTGAADHGRTGIGRGACGGSGTRRACARLGLREVDRPYRHAFGPRETRLAGRDHGVAHTQAFDDLDLARH